MNNKSKIKNQKSKLQFKIRNESKIQEIFVFNSTNDVILDYPMKNDKELLDLFVFFALSGNDSLNLQTITRHIGEQTSAFTYVIGIVKEQAQAKHEGMIKILPSGKLTNAYLKSSILLLGNEAKAKSIPSLEIEANEVKASHGATVGKLDSEQLFYLMSRGLGKPQAEQMLIQSFFETYIAKIESLPIQNKVRELLYYDRI